MKGSATGKRDEATRQIRIGMTRVTASTAGRRGGHLRALLSSLGAP